MQEVQKLPGTAYADEASAIRDAADDIGTYTALWSMRDDSKRCAEERRAANSAMDAVDRALAGLYQLRERLISDIRDSDDAAAARRSSAFKASAGAA